MRKPYISLKIERDGADFILINAELRIPRKGKKSLNVEKVCSIINQYDESIYEKRRSNEYYITDNEIIKRLLAPRVTRKNKYIGRAVVAVSLLSIIGVNALANTYTGPNNVKPQVQNIPKVVAVAKEFKTQNLSSFVAEVPVTSPKLDTYNDFDSLSTSGPEIISSMDTDDIYTTESQISEDTVFSFDYDIKTGNKEYEFVLNNTEYQNAINKYSQMYGLDPALISAKIAQENPFNARNDSNIGARGVSQIESVWWGEKLTAYNFETKEYETVVVDGNRLYDPDYAIKLGCMVLRLTYDDMYSKFVTNNTLTDSECIIAALTGYNMGGPTINKLIYNYGADYINHRNEIKWGDQKYYEHILGFLEDGTKITFKNLDGTESFVYVDNLRSDSFTK